MKSKLIRTLVLHNEKRSIIYSTCSLQHFPVSFLFHYWSKSAPVCRDNNTAPMLLFTNCHVKFPQKNHLLSTERFYIYISEAHLSSRWRWWSSSSNSNLHHPAGHQLQREENLMHLFWKGGALVKLYDILLKIQSLVQQKSAYFLFLWNKSSQDSVQSKHMNNNVMAFWTVNTQERKCRDVEVYNIKNNSFL